MKYRFSNNACATHSIEYKYSKSIWENLHPSHRSKVSDLVRALEAGTPYLALGGQRIRCNSELIRFHVGKNYRLLYRPFQKAREVTVLNRQCYEKRFKRRRNAYA